MEAGAGAVCKGSSVVTWETVCEIVAALPGTELDPADRDNPAWRVNGKVIVRRNPRLRVPGDEAMRRDRGEVVAVRTDLGLQRKRGVGRSSGAPERGGDERAESSACRRETPQPRRCDRDVTASTSDA